jgi:hypothetical protein
VFPVFLIPSSLPLPSSSPRPPLLVLSSLSSGVRGCLSAVASIDSKVQSRRADAQHIRSPLAAAHPTPTTDRFDIVEDPLTSGTMSFPPSLSVARGYEMPLGCFWKPAPATWQHLITLHHFKVRRCPRILGASVYLRGRSQVRSVASSTPSRSLGTGKLRKN